jgi:hypothetical protein
VAFAEGRPSSSSGRLPRKRVLRILAAFLAHRNDILPPKSTEKSRLGQQMLADDALPRIEPRPREPLNEPLGQYRAGA